MNENFKKWANSYSGCDGGSLGSKTWLCGIEWGYPAKSKADMEDYYKRRLPEEITKGYVELDISYNFFTDESMGYPFNLAFAKLYSAIYEKAELNYTDIQDEILKLNLSPIAFNKDDQSLWSNDLIKATGFDTKVRFIEYIAGLSRFTNIREEYKPKLIICIGNSRKEDFLKGFFGTTNIQFKREAIKPEISNKNQNNRYIYFAKYDDTLLVVTPFSTSFNGLNSNYLLQMAGSKVRRILNAQV